MFLMLCPGSERFHPQVSSANSWFSSLHCYDEQWPGHLQGCPRNDHESPGSLPIPLFFRNNYLGIVHELNIHALIAYTVTMQVAALGAFFWLRKAVSHQE
jgi:hypothetical protein